MEAQDFQAGPASDDATGAPTDEGRITRLEAVKAVLNEFIARRHGDRVGLAVFGNAAFPQAPFTEDLDVCRQLLDEAQVRMAGPRTVLGDAIGLSMLSGAHMTLAPLVVDEVRKRGIDIPVIVGGIVPDQDVGALHDAGVAKVLTPGASSDDVVAAVREAIAESD